MRGKRVEGFLTGGEAHDVKAVPELIDAIGGCTVTADRGYDRNEFRREQEGNKNTAVLPGIFPVLQWRQKRWGR
ncbi:MAG: transposase [Treponema sp.]|nr:transposase [Treponema sp.]